MAQGLVGVSADEAEQAAGLLHHHYPCLASMGMDSAFGDTLMHVSGNILKDDVAAQVKPFKQVRYHVPAKRLSGRQDDRRPGLPGGEYGNRSTMYARSRRFLSAVRCGRL